MYLLDTNVLVDFLRGRMPHGYDLMRASDPRLFKIPSIVEAELLAGAEKSRNPEQARFAVESILLPFEVVPFCSKCARHYGRIRAHLEREGKVIGPNDLLIAATALAHGATLVTGNVREFKRVPGLSLEEWAEMELPEQAKAEAAEEAVRNMEIAQIIRQGRKDIAEGRCVEGLDAAKERMRGIWQKNG